MKMNWFEYFLMTFDPGRRTYLRGIVGKLRDLSQLEPGGRILEIGCGNGTGTRLIDEIFRPGEFIATEFDERLVDIARRNNRGSTVHIEAGNAARLRFADNEFDAVLGLSVIHHIPNWRDCVDELHRVIKPGGLLIVKELSIETFETPFGRLARWFVAHPYDSMLRKDEFLDHLSQRGFKIRVCQPHSMMYLLTDFLLVARKEG
jgi:ubiquinone/menaquinone biosynthesis C-methylase UbiE